ncbi:MAG: chuR [Bradyrhizobium sp.]|nr:chuR [Bradyrhizobium sp.]
MAIELRPLGASCNIACQYCYQNVLRDAQPSTPRFDLEAVKQALDAADEPFNLFGGEPLLLPLDQLAALLGYGMDRFGTAGSIQTNGVLLTEAHVALFRQYGVPLGVSIDGPDALNDARWAGSLARTRASTDASLKAIELLLEAELLSGLMIQLTRANAVGDRLDRLCAWLAEMDGKGVRFARIHILELDDTAAREVYGLTVDENIMAFEQLIDRSRAFQQLRLDITDDKKQLLLMEDDEVVCSYLACDPQVTAAVRGMGGDGTRHKCGLTDKEGVNFLAPEASGYERYMALYHSPQAVGGCAECRFFLACKGQCPGTAINGDWRNRSEHCEVWRHLFSTAEAELLAEGREPVSRHARRPEIEAALLAAWQEGQNPRLSQLRSTLGLQLDAAPAAP